MGEISGSYRYHYAECGEYVEYLRSRRVCLILDGDSPGVEIAADSWDERKNTRAWCNFFSCWLKVREFSLNSVMITLISEDPRRVSVLELIYRIRTTYYDKLVPRLVRIR